MLILMINEWVGPGRKCTPDQRNRLQSVQGVIGMATRLPLAEAIEQLTAHKAWFDGRGLMSVCYTLLGVSEVDDIDDRLIDSMQMALIEGMQTEGKTMKLRPRNELDMIRGKMLVAAATQEELQDFLTYVTTIEGLLEEADCDDYFGTEGWRHRVGL